MNTLLGQHIFLRPLEPEDLQLLLQMENQPEDWLLSQQQVPWSVHLLENYLQQAAQDIYEAKQYRMVVALQTSKQAIGLLDFFDFDPKNKRVGIGIALVPKFQQKGFGKDALQTALHFVFQEWMVHQVYANILTHNQASIYLFKSLGFTWVGTKKDWILHRHQWHDEVMYQLLSSEFYANKTL